MSIVRGLDVCGECGAVVPNDGPGADPTKRKPCSHCGSTKRIMSGEVHVVATASVSVDAKLIIGWQEVTRLRDKAEYAAALLVAAVNIEFILWEKLRRFAPSVDLPKDIKRIWDRIRTNQPEGVTLGRLLQVAAFLGEHDKFALSPSWNPLASQINEVRKRIAHERGYFADLTQLKESAWPEDRIRQVLEEAKAFCHGNTP